MEHEAKKKLIETYFETNTTMVVDDLLEVLSEHIVAYYPSSWSKIEWSISRNNPREGTLQRARDKDI